MKGFYANIFILLSLLALVGCGASGNQPNVELIQDMMEQKNLKSQDYDEFRKEPSNRRPPAGTVPQGYSPYKYSGDAISAEAKLVNPLIGGRAESMSTLGQEKYRVYCGLCHGLEGRGDGTIAQYLALKPPSLVSDKVKDFKDGRIFHIITDGQGVMSSYASQIHSEEERWAIVNYIRALQKK